MAQDLVGQFPNEADYRLLLAGAYQDLGEMLRDAQCFDEAESAYRRAVLLAEGLFRDFPESKEFDAALHSTRTGLSVVLRANGRIQEGDEIYRKLLGRWGKPGAELNMLAKHSVNGVGEAVERARSMDIATLTEPYSLMVCAEFLILGGDPEAAVAATQRAIESAGTGFPGETEHWYYKDHGWALLSAGRAKEAQDAFRKVIEGFETWEPTPSNQADPDHWIAAYFLDLVSQEQYTQRWKDVRVIFAHNDSMPWFYVGQRAEIEGRVDDAISAYQTAVELGKVPSPHMTANFSAYRLQVLTSDRNGGGQRASDELSETVEG
jgi:tetratricopeptide (TPR) repeat protein